MGGPVECVKRTGRSDGKQQREKKDLIECLFGKFNILSTPQALIRKREVYREISEAIHCTTEKTAQTQHELNYREGTRERCLGSLISFLVPPIFPLYAKMG